MDRLSIFGDSGRTLVIPLAAFLILLGAFVLLGWAVGSEAMVRILPSSVAMGFNATAAFVAVGIMLISQRRISPDWRRVRLGLATALIVLFSIILIEHWLDTSLGVDWVRLHQTVADNNPRPGRVAPNTSLAFLLTGLVFLLLEGRRTIRGRARGARFLTYVIFAIGIAGLLGYVLELEWLYQWHRYVTIEANRLGLVMKQDTEELFQPLRQRLAALVGLIALLVFASAYILRSSIRPLAAQLLNAETEARKNAAALGVSMNALKQSTDDLRASETEVRT